MNKNNKYLALARREFWEHRSLWMVPIGAAILMLVTAQFGALNINGNGFHMTLDSGVPQGGTAQIGAVSLLGVAISIGLFAGIVIFVYLLDSLFSERKDRSILFWKSLPVSDAETVISKLAVALVLVPLLVLLLSLLLQPLLAGILAMRFPATRPYMGEMLAGGIVALPNLIGIGLIGLLWYAPIATYVMLASVLAKRAPITYAALPPVALGVAERLVFGTKHVFQFIGQRLAPWPSQAHVVTKADNGWVSLANDWWKELGEPALWLGLVAAAAMTYAVIRLRRYRDDT